MPETPKTKQILTIPNLLSMFRILLIPLIVWLYCGRGRELPERFGPWQSVSSRFRA